MSVWLRVLLSCLGFCLGGMLSCCQLSCFVFGGSCLFVLLTSCPVDMVIFVLFLLCVGWLLSWCVCGGERGGETSVVLCLNLCVVEGVRGL